MRFFSNLGFKTKLLMLCLFMAAVSITIGTISFFGLQSVTAEYRHITDIAMPNLEQSNEMLAEFRRIRINIRTLALPGLGDDQEKAALKNVDEAIAEFEKAVAIYERLEFVDGEREIFNEVLKSWSAFKEMGMEALALNKSGTPEDEKKLVAIFLNDCPQKAAVFTKHIKALISLHKQEAKKHTAMAESTASKTNIFVLATIIIGVLSGLSVGFIFASVVTRSIMNVTTHLSENADEVSAASTQIAASSQQLSQAATEQAASLQETSSAVEELSSMVNKNTENARGTAHSTSESQQKAGEGREAVERMIASMDEISQSNESIMNQITHSNQQMFDIVKVIHEIESKTKVINDIVFQTKLLSFNASVEAARAGEHGKGFAVVAEEVGNLAQMSGNAAKEISAMLESSVHKVEGLVNETKTRVESLASEGKRKIENGVDVAKHCGDILGEIVTNASGISNMASEISSASQEQAQGISEINKAMNQLDQVTQQNAAASGESASAAEKLASQSESLKSSVADLMRLMTGAGEENVKTEGPAKVIHMAETKIRHIKSEKKEKVVWAAKKSETKVASGQSFAPNRNDPGFGE